MENWKDSKHKSYIKIGDCEKKFCKYKTGDKYWQLCMEEKLAIASYNNPNELYNQRSEILNIGIKPWLPGK